MSANPFDTAEDDDDFVADFLTDCMTEAERRGFLTDPPSAPKPTSTASLVAVHFDCTAGCDSPTGCRGSDG